MLPCSKQIPCSISAPGTIFLLSHHKTRPFSPTLQMHLDPSIANKLPNQEQWIAMSPTHPSKCCCKTDKSSAFALRYNPVSTAYESRSIQYYPRTCLPRTHQKQTAKLSTASSSSSPARLPLQPLQPLQPLHKTLPTRHLHPPQIPTDHTLNIVLMMHHRIRHTIRALRLHHCLQSYFP